MDVIIRKIDQNLHRRLKAKAAIRGMTLSKALEEAIRMWVRTEDRASPRDETELSNRAYEGMKQELARKYPNKFVVFTRERFLGSADSLEDAGSLARRNNAGKALIKKIGDVRSAGGEWFWSSLEL